MRFDRMRRAEPYNWTARKERAFPTRHTRVAKKIERDYPLFSDEFAPEPETDVEGERVRREQMTRRSDQRMRDLQAEHWRKGRAAYFACEPDVRARIEDEWLRWRGPAGPTYFIYVVEKHNGEAERRSARIAEREAEIRARVAEQIAAERATQGQLLDS